MKTTEEKQCKTEPKNGLATLNDTTKTGSLARLKQSTNELKIRNLGGFKEIGFALFKVFEMLGIKGKNLPDEDQRALLLDFVTKQYGKYSIDEINHAFELGITRELEPFFAKNESISNFGGFTVAYFGSVMSAFEKYKRSKLSTASSKKSAQLPEHGQIETYVFLKNNLIDKFPQYKNGFYPWDFGIERTFYKDLQALELLRLSDDDKREMWREVAKRFEIKEFENEKLKHFAIKKECEIIAFREWCAEMRQKKVNIEKAIQNAINKKLKS